MLTVFDVVILKEKIAKKQEESLKPEVFTNPDLCAKINKDLKVMMAKVDKLDSLEKKVSDLNDYIEMCELEGDQSMLQDINISLDNLKIEIEELYLQTLLSGDYDNNNAIIKNAWGQLCDIMRRVH